VVGCLLIEATNALKPAAVAKSKEMEREKIDIGQWTTTQVSLWAEKHLSKTYANEIKKLNDRVIDGNRLVRLDKDFNKLGFENNTMKDKAGKKMKDQKGNKIKSQTYAFDQIRPLIQEWGLYLISFLIFQIFPVSRRHSSQPPYTYTSPIVLTHTRFRYYLV
jgi:hypothetical protein